jgi:hypothetical protein
MNECGWLCGSMLVIGLIVAGGLLLSFIALGVASIFGWLE